MWVITRKGKSATLLELLNTFGQRELPFVWPNEKPSDLKYYITGMKAPELKARYCRLVGVESWKFRGKGVQAEKVVSPRNIEAVKGAIHKVLCTGSADDWQADEAILQTAARKLGIKVKELGL